ncbi:acyltransferase [Actinocorallia sp. B10E7]|uniref:acyltransferase family protein n=1 Tax=Actinocorallia sp. B10E7 TaxID=3153558 RepID=UPI00325F0419
MAALFARRERPDGPGHLAALDGLRAAAILLVVCTHVGAATGANWWGGIPWRMIGNGTVGVPIFFVLSGFLLYRPFARAALGDTDLPAVRGYLRRRALRVLPAYWLMLPFGLLVAENARAGQPFTWLQLVTLTHIYDPDRWWEGESLSSIWSLAVEAFFYLLLPLLAWAMHRWGRGSARRLLAMALGLAAVSLAQAMIVRYAFDLKVVFYLEPLPPRTLGYFGLGMALAVMAERPGRWAARIGAAPGVGWVIALCLLALVATPLGTPLSGPQSAHQYLVAGLLFPAIAVAAVAPAALAPGHPFTRAVLGNRVAAGFGRISYGVFLWHTPILMAWYRWTGRPMFLGDFWLVLGVVLPLSLLVAVLSHDLVEQPLQRFARRAPRLRATADGGEGGARRVSVPPGGTETREGVGA